MPRFTLIDGTPAPDTPREQMRKRVKSMPKPPDIIQCHRCGSREMIQTRINMVYKNHKPTGGTKVLVCFNCATRGERVVVI